MGSRALCAREPGHILHSKIGKLAYQAKSESIFAKGEYLGGIPFGMPFFFLLLAVALLVAALVLLCQILRGRDEKSSIRMKILREKALTDEQAAKQTSLAGMMSETPILDELDFIKQVKNGEMTPFHRVLS